MGLYLRTRKKTKGGLY